MAGTARELASAMADLPVAPTHYDRLGVSPQATMAQIRAAFEAWQAVQASTAAAAITAAPTAPAHAEAASCEPGGAPGAAMATPQAPEQAFGDPVAETRLAYAVVSDPMRRRVYDEYLISQRKVSAHAGRWWRRPGFGRAVSGWGVALLALASVGYVGLLIWRLF